MLYKGHKNIYDFTKVRTICASGNATQNDIIAMCMTK